jgi:hypothetical protein
VAGSNACRPTAFRPILDRDSRPQLAPEHCRAKQLGFLKAILHASAACQYFLYVPSHYFVAMRLINCAKAVPTFEDRAEDDLPRYAILSHTWGKYEVTFIDILQLQAGNLDDQHWKSAPEFRKLSASIEWASAHDYEYIWIDTCCIDKSSSAELQEAINSMYRWYRDADVCFAYLQDTWDLECFMSRKSRWFKRGWTLQELLAPRQSHIFVP